MIFSKGDGGARDRWKLLRATLNRTREYMDEEVLFRFATGKATPQEEARVAEWLSTSPEHEEALAELVDVLELTAEAEAELDFGPPPTGEDLTGRGKRRAVSWRVIASAAAAVLILAVSIPLARQFVMPTPASPASGGFSSGEFSTEAEPATVSLPDGSIIRLASESRLRLHERRDTREVSLDGRGYFAVAPDPEVPFTIRSDAGTLTVLGTRFDLSVSGRDLRLIVTEGRVRLTARGRSVDVDAGQMAQVLDGNLIPPIDVPDPEALIGWIGNFIVFQSTPLEAVVREVEKRHGVRIELDGPGLESRTVTALFAGRSFEEITEVICLVAKLVCSMEGDVLKMRPMP